MASSSGGWAAWLDGLAKQAVLWVAADPVGAFVWFLVVTTPLFAAGLWAARQMLLEDDAARRKAATARRKAARGRPRGMYKSD